MADVMSLLQSAAAAFQQGRLEEALALGEKALQAAPGHPEAQHLVALALGRMGRVDDAVPLYDAAAQRHPQRHAILTNKGNALRAASRYEEAITAYTAATDANPQFAAAFEGLGAAHRQNKEPEKAEDALRKGLAVAPNHINLNNNLGVLLVDQGRRPEAIACFSIVLEQNPNALFALVNRGSALRFEGRTADALADHNRAVDLAPQDAEAQYQLGNSLRQAGDLPAAEAAYTRAISIAPQRPDIHGDLARMLWEMGESNRFLQPIESAIQKSPSEGLLATKGELALRAGQLDVAENAASMALSLNENSARGYRILGRVRRHQGNLPAAVAELEASQRVAADDFETLHELAETLLAKGDYKAAVAVLERDPPGTHLQKHIAIKAIAMRLSGDEAYQRFYDYERLTRKIVIETPPGFASLKAFNDALVAAIEPLHATTAQPLDQTLYGGTQSVGRLWDEPNPVIQALKNALLQAASVYKSGLPDDPDHPFLARKPENLTCAGAWSVMLSSGGGHVDHIHPEGWVSAVYYVRVPPEVTNSDQHAGFLRIGASGIEGIDLPAERWIEPVEGAVFFFPSYIWHGVEKFASDGFRITAPFDLAPAT